MKKLIGHTKMILTHKKYVYKYCAQAGIRWRGITHDLSKFSPTEFFESVKYYTGTCSPIDECKKAKGYSKAWFHHRSRNRHHWEYYVDNYEKGMEPVLMPFVYNLELICDYLGAGNAYEKENWTLASQYKWWENKRKTVVMHPVNIRFTEVVLHYMGKANSTSILRVGRYLENTYNAIKKEEERRANG